VKRVEPPSQHPPVLVTVQAGPILDYNGHLVPDGTPVEFVVTYQNGQTVNVPVVHTLQGQVEAAIELNGSGLVEIRARSGAAASQRPQVVNLAPPPTSPADTPTSTATLEPTATPTHVPTKTATITPSPTLEPAATDTPSPAISPESTPISKSTVDRDDLFITLTDILLTSIMGMFLWQRAYRTLSERIRLILVTFIGGMVGYLLYGIGWLRPDLWLIPAATLIVQRLTLAGLVLLFGLLGCLIEKQLNTN
jgi:hypothetical protein